MLLRADTPLFARRISRVEDVMRLISRADLLKCEALYSRISCYLAT